MDKPGTSRTNTIRQVASTNPRQKTARPMRCGSSCGGMYGIPGRSYGSVCTEGLEGCGYRVCASCDRVSRTVAESTACQDIPVAIPECSMGLLKGGVIIGGGLRSDSASVVAV